MRFPLPAPMLEFLILACLEKQDSYGYEICQTIKTIQNIKEPVPVSYTHLRAHET